MKRLDAKHFDLFDNTNASKLLGDKNMTDVTSYITGAFTNGGQLQDKRVTMLVTGDMMLDRYVRKTIAVKGFDSFFASTPRFWSGTDITLANLEGCFTDNPPSPLDPNDLSFTVDPALLSTLKKYQFNIEIAEDASDIKKETLKTWFNDYNQDVLISPGDRTPKKIASVMIPKEAPEKVVSFNVEVTKGAEKTAVWSGILSYKIVQQGAIGKALC